MKKMTMLLGVFVMSVPVFYGQEIPKFNSEAEKAAWIQTHPKEYEQISGTKVELAQPKTEQDKEAWIKENPAHYQSIGGSTEVPEFKTKEEKDRYFENLNNAKKEAARDAELEALKAQKEMRKVSEIDPTFPVAEDQSSDEYFRAKDEWISNNLEKYATMQNLKEEAKPENE